MYALSVDIVLATLNARYSHAAMGLRCLRANLGSLRARSVILEGVIDERPLDFVERILAHQPRVVGLSVYIWNTAPLLEVVRVLKEVAPEVVVVVGGPEVSYEVETQEICARADFVVRREGERAFAELAEALLKPSALPVARDKVIDGGADDLDGLQMPYDEYTTHDLERRNVYLEASRGCPFRCAFCLSALDKKVRPFGTRFLGALDELYARGLRHFRFVDRTFNLDIEHARAILERFIPRDDGQLFLHFEMVPDRLPDELFASLAQFSSGTVQLEVGFQTFNEDVARTIDRRTRYDVALANIARLRAETGVHIHADLIAGLPGEDLESFGRGFDRLFAAGPHEIQLGILKRLKGYPLEDKAAARALRFSREPPFEVLQSDALSFAELQGLRRAARVFDLVFNHGRYPRTRALLESLWKGAVFDGIWRLQSSWSSFHKIAQVDLAERLFNAALEAGASRSDAERAVNDDYCEGGRRRTPPFLTGGPRRQRRAEKRGLPPRQARHAERAK